MTSAQRGGKQKRHELHELYELYEVEAREGRKGFFVSLGIRQIRGIRGNVFSLAFEPQA